MNPDPTRTGKAFHAEPACRSASHRLHVDLDRAFTGFANLDRAFTGFENLDRTFTGLANLDRAFTGFANLDRAFTGFGNLDPAFTGFANLDPAFTGFANLDRAFTGFGNLDRTLTESPGFDGRDAYLARMGAVSTGRPTQTGHRRNEQRIASVRMRFRASDQGLDPLSGSGSLAVVCGGATAAVMPPVSHHGRIQRSPRHLEGV
jgi:hypothetical protein